MSDWQTIDTAPKDGTVIRACRMIDGTPTFDGKAAWRTVTFRDDVVAGMFMPEETVTGWMRPDVDKRVPEPTHWMHTSTQVEA